MLGWASGPTSEQSFQKQRRTIGSRIVPEIDKTDIESVLRPLWETKTVTAKKLRGRMERVLSLSTVKGYREGDNPARWNESLLDSN